MSLCSQRCHQKHSNLAMLWWIFTAATSKNSKPKFLHLGSWSESSISVDLGKKVLKGLGVVVKIQSSNQFID